MQTRLDPETGVSKPFKNVSCLGRIQNFFQGEGTNFRHFFKRIFSADLILSNLSTKNKCKGSGGMLPWKNFENLLTEMVNVVLFEQFLGKFVIFWPLTLSV